MLQRSNICVAEKRQNVQARRRCAINKICPGFSYYDKLV